MAVMVVRSLAAENDSPDWIRTSDQSINSRPLYR